MPRSLCLLNKNRESKFLRKWSELTRYLFPGAGGGHILAAVKTWYDRARLKAEKSHSLY